MAWDKAVACAGPPDTTLFNISPGVVDRTREPRPEPVLPEEAIGQVPGGILREPEAVIAPVQAAEHEPGRKHEGELPAPARAGIGAFVGRFQGPGQGIAAAGWVGVSGRHGSDPLQ